MGQAIAPLLGKRRKKRRTGDAWFELKSDEQCTAVNTASRDTAAAAVLVATGMA